MNNIIFKTTFLKGEDGNSILRIDKTATTGLVDTYTITLTDGSNTTFNVTNGSSIATIEKTATVGIVDTYTITLTDGSTSTFEVTNGTVPVDDHLDANSTNPVQNKIVTGAINNANNYDNTTSGLTASTKQGAIDELAVDLNGFKFYPAGEVDLVASVSDNSYYTDSDGNYILADSPTGETLIDDVTYKALASNEDLRGKVGTDTAVEFGGKTMKVKEILVLQNGTASSRIAFATISNLTTKVINFSRALLSSSSITNLEGEYFSVSVGSNSTVKAKKAGKYAIYKLTSTGVSGGHENYAYIGTYDKSVNENIINDSWDASLEYYVEALE